VSATRTPGSQDAEDGPHDERAHDQRVEPQADRHGGTDLTNGSQVAVRTFSHAGFEILKTSKRVAR
jgi:hypothetical protein